MTRPLVTRADLDAQASAQAEEAARPKGLGGIFGGLFRKKGAEAPARPTGTPAAIPNTTVTPAAPRRMRATELRGDSSSRTATTPAPRGRGGAVTPAGQARGRTSTVTPATPAASRGRGRQQQELPAAGPGTEPDEFETKLIIEIYQMPPGRSGFKTIKTIEETLRSKAGQLGGTRKEIPDRLDRLEAMGIFKRESRPRGTGQVSTGDLVAEHPVVARITADQPAPRAAAPRALREPRRLRPSAESTTEAPTAETAAPETEEVAEPEAAQAETEAAVAAAAAGEPLQEPAPTPAEEPATPFRWVSGTPDPVVEAAEEEPAKAPRKRATTTRTSKPRTARPKKAEEVETAAAEGSADETDDVEADKEPSPA